MVTRIPDLERALCPTGCGRKVGPGKFLCPVCWRVVPKLVRKDMAVSWMDWQANPTAEQWDRFLDARDRAIRIAAS